jgi:hypothetical protein
VEPESSTPVTGSVLARVAASAALSLVLSPIVTAPLAFHKPDLPDALQVQRVSLAGLGALLFVWLGRSAGPSAPRGRARPPRGVRIRRTLFTALGAGAVCVAIPAVLALSSTAAWRVFSRTSTWAFSTIPVDYGCWHPEDDRQ